jgi:polysaccharide export outer membrane protein
MDLSPSLNRVAIALCLLAALPLAAQTPAPAALQPRPRYMLRAGDVITVEYRYTPEFNQTLTIQPDGFVDLTLIGEARVAGMTLAKVHDFVVERSSVKLKDPEVNVSLKEFEKPYFAVAGEVEHPGKFDFYDKTTALQAVLLAGGFKETAQQSDVYVFRRVNGGLAEVHTLNLKHMRKGHDLERDLVLEPGDMILVPRNKLENISRFIKAANLGIYFDPLTYALQ